MHHILPLLLDAHVTVNRFPSRAEDAGSRDRTMKHLLTRCVNSAAREYNVCVAALALLRHPHEDFSTSFVFCHIDTALTESIDAHAARRVV